MSKSWIDAYSPKKKSELTSNTKSIQQVENWLNSYQKNKKIYLKETKGQKKKRKPKGTVVDKKYSSILITGNHGTGKTTAIKLILKHYGYQIKTMNFAEIKDRKKSAKKKSNENIIKKTLEINDILNRMHNKEVPKVAIVIDELESITSNSEKAVLLELREENDSNWYCPMIFISNNKHNKVLTDIKKQCMEIKFFPPCESDMRKLLLKIVKKEKINIKNNDVAVMIIDHSQDDYRRLILTLEDIKSGYDNQKITEEILDKYFENAKKKDIDFDLFNAANQLLSNFESIDDCLRLYEIEKTLLPLMMHENYPNYVMANYKDSEDSFRISDKISSSLSEGDVIENCIYGDQNWDMQEIHGLMSCVTTSYNLHMPDRTSNYTRCNFTTDLNKTSIKKINAKNINDADRCFKNLDIFDYIYMNKIIRKKISEGDIKGCIELLKGYNIKLEHIEKLLKIDKIKDSKNNLTSKQKKEFTKHLAQNI
jgi:DNA polymerase III delta prime subunit